MEKMSSFRPNLRIFGVTRKDPGWIYLIKSNGLYKIGKTSNPTRREREARTWLPDLEMIGIKPFWDVSEKERLIHLGLTYFWHEREWFKFGDDEFEEVFVETFQEFYEEDRDMNSVDFIYWFNSSGMSGFVTEQNRQKLSLKKFLQKHKRD
jgi:hypothetical protein